MDLKSLIVSVVALAVLGMTDRQQPWPLVPTHGSAIPFQGNREMALASSLRFEANLGQTSPTVKFLARGNGYILLLTSHAVVFVSREQSGGAHFTTTRFAAESDSRLGKPSGPLVVQLLRSSRHVRLRGLDPLPGRVHYWIGQGERPQPTGVPMFGEVVDRGVYPGIDLALDARNGQLRIYWVVHRGAHLNRIRLSIDGAFGHRVEFGPGAGGPRQTSGHVINSGITSLALQWLRSQPLPARRSRLAYAAYLAGNGDDIAQAVAADGHGNVYVTGSTQSTTFPVVSAAQRANGGGLDAFVTKLDPRGHVIYSTYLGGRGDDAGSGIAVDSVGNAYITGWTHSGNFPTVAAAQQRFGGVFDAFVSKLSSDGARLLFSTYLGGANDDRGNAIALGGADQVFIAGSTTSVDFPTMFPLQVTIHGPSDAFAAAFTSGGTLRWSTYYGGTREDTAHGVAVDPRGNVYLSGSTSSFDFPVVAPLQRAYGGGRSDAWMAKFSATPRAVQYSTYLGGKDADQAAGIAIDARRNVYLTGDTSSRNFPTVHAHQNRLGGGSCLNPSTGKLSPCTDVFVAEVNGTGRKLLFSTFLGGTGDDAGHSLALDRFENIYVGGETNSSSFPVRDALQPSFGGGTCDQGYGPLPCSDAFLLELTAGGRNLAYSTYLGGPANDAANGVAVDKTGSMYVTGLTWAPTFPAGTRTHPEPRPSPHAFVAHDVSAVQ